mmetsp:Transcript_24506/g.49735  ORF Transcript_24506/g.49735 Transcript_24506/m.49735 type:complete len:160 (-) Transcript_24506:58-537(-)
MDALDAGAERRLREALDVLASGELPECPVCLDIPVTSDARILRCCAKIMCKTCIPSCNSTCPFCRAPFLAREAEDGESPYTYSTKDYSIHSHFRTSNDYTSSNYTSSNDYTAHSIYTATNDYSATSSSYTARDYSSGADYSSITSKYCASSAASGDEPS